MAHDELGALLFADCQ
jgi:hypothetical protein